MSDGFDDTTEPLVNGAELPSHPALTNAKKVTEYGRVWDDADGITLLGGLHNNEIQRLMAGDQMSLTHLYRYAIRNRHIYHTRQLVCIDVKTEDADVLESTPCPSSPPPKPSNSSPPSK